MHKSRVIIYLLPLFLFACNQQNGNQITINPPKIEIDQDTLRIIKEFKGLYTNVAGIKTFIACDQPGILHAVENSDQIDSLFKKALPNSYPGQAIYVEMRAEINSSPNKGFADMLAVKECLKVEQKNHKNTCILSDYWGFGMEPFWQLQISGKENLIDFYNPMEQQTTHFSYAAPEIKGGITNYSSTEGANKISIVIKKEKCNGAIDPQYEYSIKIILNGITYSGCGIKFINE